MKTKRFLSMLLCVALAVSCLTGMTVSASADDVVSYTVKNGDYLYKVCKNSGLDYYTCKSAIMILNGWSTETQCNRIIPGQTIILPVSNAVAATVKSSATSTSSKTESVTINGKTYSSSSTSTISTAANSGDSIAYYLVAYTVKSGDYIAKICSDLGTSYTAYKSIINSVNGLSSTKIYAGKVLYIPVSSAPSSGSFYAVMSHRVDKGETMTTICSTYGANASSTMTKGVNDGTNLNYLQAGQVVYVPVAASSVNTGSGTGTGTSTGTGYNINLEYTSSHGIPTASVNGSVVSKAASGSTVTIAANGKNGYAQKSITVTRADNNSNVVVTNNTFTMPPCDVNVTVNYDAGGKLVLDYNVIGGSFQTYVNGSAVESACYGNTVVLKMNYKTGYVIDEAADKSYYKYTAADGSEKTAAFTYGSDGTISFKMPAIKDGTSVTVKVTFVNKVSSLKINCINSTKTHAAVTFKVDGVTATKAAKYSTVEMTVAPKSGYTVSQVKVYNKADNKELTVTSKGNNVWSFTMPNAEVNVDVQYVNAHSLTATSNAGGSIAVCKKDSTGNYITASIATEGETIYVYPYENSGWKLERLKVSWANGASVLNFNTTNFTTLTDANGKQYFSFKMPAQNITIDPIWSSEHAELKHYAFADGGYNHCTYAITVQNGLGNGYNIQSYACPGNSVHISICPETGYKVEAVAYSLDGKNYDTYYAKAIGNGGYEFTVPSNVSDKIYIRISCKADVETTVDFSAKAVFCTDKSLATEIAKMSSNYATISTKVNGTTTDNAISGATVAVEYTIPEGYTFKSITAQTSTALLSLDASNGVCYYTIKGDEGKITFNVNYYASSTPFTVQKSEDTYTVGTEYYPGQTVTVNTAGTTYFVEDSVNVFTDNGSRTAIAINMNEAGSSFTFVMPNSNVSIEAHAK